MSLIQVCVQLTNWYMILAHGFAAHGITNQTAGNRSAKQTDIFCYSCNVQFWNLGRPNQPPNQPPNHEDRLQEYGGKCRNTLNCKKLLCIRSSCRKDCVENGYPLLQGQRRHCCSRGKHVGTTTRYCICLPDSGGYGSDNLYDSSKCTSSSDCCNKRSKCKNGLCTPPESDASCLATGSLCFVPFTKACCGQCVVTGPTGIEQRCT